MATYVNYESLYRDYEDSKLISKYANYALWTTPGAFPEMQTAKTRGNYDIEHDYQSVGALLVNSLAPKLAGLLFPYHQPFFKIKFTKAIRDFMQQRGKDPKKSEGELIQMEQDAMSRLFINASYAQLIQAIRYLIITGNALIIRKDGKMIAYSPRNFVVLRDNIGTVLDVVLKEVTTYGSLDNEVRKLVEGGIQRKDFDEVTVYTRIKRTVIRGNPNFVVTKQINGKGIGDPVFYPEKLCPYIVAGWNLVNGDSYCRGMIEDYAGDFAKLSDLSRALAIYEIDACKVVNCVKPGSGSDVDAFNAAENGDWVQADPDSVSKHESGDAAKIQQLQASIQGIFGRLSTAFMYGGNTREAERVTAEEIRRNAQEADQSLGGVYSLISAFVHEPIAYQLCYEVNPEFVVAVTAGEVQIEMQTGTAALGRSADISALLKATQEISVIVPALAQASKRFDVETIIDRILRSNGINVDDYTFTEEELRQLQEQEQAMMPQDPTAMMQGAEAIQGVM